MNKLLWRHVKRGGTYMVLGDTCLQSSGGPVAEGAPLTTYVSMDDGAVWARPTAEFHDGRFEPVEGETEASTLYSLVAFVLSIAAEAGYVITVDQRPNYPLAMGNYRSVASIRKART